MLKLFSTIAPAIALVLIAVLLLEPPSLSPGDRVPTLRLLSGGPVEADPATPVTPLAKFLGTWQVSPAVTAGDRGTHPDRVVISIDGSGQDLRVVYEQIGTRQQERLRFSMSTDRLSLDRTGNVHVATTVRTRRDGVAEHIVDRYAISQGSMEWRRTITRDGQSFETGAVFERRRRNGG
jgi:hypothetical protein